MIIDVAPHVVFSAAAFLFLGGLLCGAIVGVARIRAANDGRVLPQRGLGVITIRSETQFVFNRCAARMLGVENDTGVNLSGLPKLLRGEGAALPMKDALDGLVGFGRRFQMLARTTAGRLVAVEGAPSGDRAVICIRDADAHETALADALAERETTSQQAAIAEAVLEATGAIAVRISINDGDPVSLWQSPGFEALPPHAQRLILTHPPKVPSPEDAARRVMVEATAPNTDARPVHFALTWTAMDDKTWICSASDVSAEVEAEAMFRRFVDTMSETFAHLEMCLLIFDDERRLTLFNPATVDLVGIETKWLAQRPTLKAMLDRLRERRMTPDQADFISWRDKVLERTNYVADRNDTGMLEDRWHLANGRTLHVLARPHRSGGLAVVIEDITDAVALRRQSVSERAVHIATTDVLEEAIVLFAPNGAARLSNGSFRALWSLPTEADVTGRHVRDIVAHCHELAPDDDFWRQLTDSVTGEVGRGALTAKLMLKETGKVMLARISPVPDGSVLAVFADVTDSERIAAALTDRNDALEQAQEMRVALIDQISHQMRTPLNTVFGFGDMLAKEHVGALTPQQKDYVGGIVAASHELLQAINGMTNMIDLDQSEALTAEPGGTPAQLLADVIDIVNRRHGRQMVVKVPRDADLTTGPRAMVVQAGHLRQVMFNMITEAIAHASAQDPSDAALASEHGATETEACVAEAMLGVDGTEMVIRCGFEGASDSANASLAMAMAARLATLLKGTFRAHDCGERRILECRLPLSLIAPDRVAPTPNEPAAALPTETERETIAAR